MITHSGKKKYAWRFCDKKFALEQYKREHEYIHTGETPYVCGIDGCTESFRQRAKLCLHRASHKGYKKKSYKVYSRKDTVKKTRKSKVNLTMPTSDVTVPAQNLNQNYSYMADPATQEMFNLLAYGYDYMTSLLSTVSANYCLWDLAGVQPQQATSFGCCQHEGQSVMEKARQGLSTLKIPTAFKSEDAIAPQMLVESPTTLAPLDTRSFQDLSHVI